jgi:hypothetical protein
VTGKDIHTYKSGFKCLHHLSNCKYKLYLICNTFQGKLYATLLSSLAPFSFSANYTPSYIMPHQLKTHRFSSSSSSSRSLVKTLSVCSFATQQKTFRAWVW